MVTPQFVFALPSWSLSALLAVSPGPSATYAVTVDALATSPDWTAESDQEGSFLGYTVATAGDVNDDGYADVIVGAPFYDNGETEEGRAFVYLGSGSGLATSPAWTAESDQAGANFGYSVATAGDVNGDGCADVIVGAPSYDNGQSNEGRAFVYLGSRSGLATSPAWTVESDQVNSFFGYAVATAGDVDDDTYADVIVGAPLYDNRETDEGRAFVYLGSDSGLATSPAWTAESDQAGVHIGDAVATAGDVNGDGYADVIVGARKAARIFVFHGSEEGLATKPTWTAESDQATSLFGDAVATAGDVNGDGYADIVVGARSYDNGQADEGRAFVYHGSEEGLATLPAWTAEGDQAVALFGSGVATAGDINGDGYADVIVGARLYDNDQMDEGRAFIYHGSEGGLSPSPGCMAEGDQAGAQFGRVATAGDVNDDGYADVIVGADSYDNGQSNEGRAFVYLGSADEACVRCGRPVVCNDGDVCTTDSCDPASGCVFTSNTAPCNDGNACTTGEICGGGICRGGTSITAPPETDGLTAAADKATYYWSAAAFATQYDVVRGRTNRLPVGPGGAAEVCFDNLSGTSLVDTNVPPNGIAFWYLSRGENACGAGTYGTQSDGSQRITATCP